MSNTPTRVFGIICVLAGLWIVVYWLYDPTAKEPRVTFGDRPDALAILSTLKDPIADPKPAFSPEPRPTAPRVEPPSSPPSSKDDPTTPAAARYTSYTIQRGDSGFAAIAQKLLGDKRRWTEIARANPFVDPTRLIPGRTTIRIPTPAAAAADLAPPRREPEPAPAKEPAPAEQQVQKLRTHVIDEGDTLSSIAERYLGRSADWRLIFEANTKVLSNPDKLPLGATITIPDRR